MDGDIFGRKIGRGRLSLSGFRVFLGGFSDADADAASGIARACDAKRGAVSTVLFRQ